MSSVSKRVALGLLTLVGLVLTGVGLWFSSHLGSEGSATSTARPGAGRLMVLEPSVLNRVDSSVTITAKAEPGTEVWIGRATPSDARAWWARRRGSPSRASPSLTGPCARRRR